MNSMTGHMKRFLALEAASGLMLCFTALVALVAVNSPLRAIYEALLQLPLGFGEHREPLLLWINDGLMTLFFLVVSLEIKREMMQGQLASRDRALLPCIAALGGVVVPALIFLGFNHADAAAARGWAVPSATDIAFSLGVISLLGSRVPASLKIFLTTLAVIDDLAAILIIALFYNSALSLSALGVAAGCMVVLIALNRFGVRGLWVYMLVGFVLWLAVLFSGLHATLAGVLLGFMIPLRQKQDCKASPPLIRLEQALHPWVAYGIMPLFAFANAGLSFEGMHASQLFDPISLGIILGLLIGKPIGIFSVTYLAVKIRFSQMPEEAGWGSLFGMSCLGGIGFTMSLFIAGLAFTEDAMHGEAKLGILLGSVLSALLGYGLLRIRKA